MKKALLVILAILVMIVALGWAGYRHLGKAAAAARQESQSFVDRELPRILGDWDAGRLEKLASPELLRETAGGQLTRLFTVLSERLGPLKEYQGSRGEANVTFDYQGVRASAVYVSRATFEKAPAQIFTGLRKADDGRWRIQELRVDSPVLKDLQEPRQEAALRK